MEKQRNTWASGRRYLLQWDVPGIITTAGGPRTSRIRGEAVLVVRGDHEKMRGLYVDRFGIAAAGVEARKSHTGAITVRGLSSTGTVRFGRGFDTLRVEVTCDINYESLDRAKGRQVDKGCYYIPATEPASATIEAQAIVARGRLRLESTRIHVSCAAGGFEEVVAIEIMLKGAILAPMAAPGVRYRLGKDGNWVPSKDSNIDSNICVSTTRRQLIVQPVGFSDSATDANPSGNTAAAQLATAQTIWNKACIDLVVRTTVTIMNATLKTSSDMNSIRNAYTDTDPNVIEVFFVDNALSATGGGNAGAIGMASCKVVIAEPNNGNPVLVAHELGHVLNLVHPGTGSNSDPGTVMAPTGSAMIPGTDLVTHMMCTSIANPVLQTTTTTCCLSHDIPNHYLRDFPTDVGNEPSEPIGAGMNRYAMSNVWNRLTNTPGTPSATTGPEHEQPVRYNADMTDRTNYLFAKVEQLVNLPVHSAVVKFFLKNPGSGGGASYLQLLGQVSVPSTLSVGSPQNVSLPWTVPAGVPKHSCIFAVVRSDAEPEGDQSSLDWWQFENLSYNDNDWAQRNLDIEDISSANTGDLHMYESPLFFLHLPPARLRLSSTLTLVIDATRARPLRALRLEVIGGRTITLSPGRVQSANIDIRNVRERMLVLFHAEIPGGLKVGTDLTICVSPFIGKRPLIGWAIRFRVAQPRNVVAQVLDDAAAAFGDLAHVADLPGVHALFCRIAKRECERPYSLGQIVDHMSGVRSVLKQAQSELNRLGAGRQTGAGEATRKLIEVLDSCAAGKADVEAAIAALRAMANRAMIAAALLSRRD